MMLVVDFLWMLFIRLKNFLYSLSLLHVYIMKGKRILLNDFSEFIELVMCLCFYFVDMVYISWFLDIEPTLYFCDKSHLVMLYIIHCMCCWICFGLSYYFALIVLFFWLLQLNAMFIHFFLIILWNPWLYNVCIQMLMK